MIDRAALADEADAMLRELFPICRSITGEGFRQSLEILGRYAPMRQHDYPSGMKCFDWTIPPEWTIRDAYIADSRGRRVIDFRRSNLHVVSYSVPFRARMTLAELRGHLHTLPALPDAIPYRTSYYTREWGFCLSHRQLQALDPQETYDVVVDSELADGYLTLADDVIRGDIAQEFLISTYCCHPSLANDNLSGVVLTVLLHRILTARRNRYSYRFLIAPETIGVLVYLSQNEAALRAITGGFVVATVGGPGPLGYKRTFLGDHLIDRAVLETFQERGIEPKIYPFAPDGSDERQFSSPGFRIPMGTICKDKYYEYPSYHTSLDDLDFVSGKAIVATLEIYLGAIDRLEQERIYVRRELRGELHLGRHGLYPSTGGGIHQPGNTAGFRLDAEGVAADDLDPLLWCLFLMDGRHSLKDIVVRSRWPLAQIERLAGILVRAGLVEAVR